MDDPSSTGMSSSAGTTAKTDSEKLHELVTGHEGRDDNSGADKNEEALEASDRPVSARPRLRG